MASLRQTLWKKDCSLGWEMTPICFEILGSSLISNHPSSVISAFICFVLNQEAQSLQFFKDKAILDRMSASKSPTQDAKKTIFLKATT